MPQPPKSSAPIAFCLALSLGCASLFSAAYVAPAMAQTIQPPNTYLQAAMTIATAIDRFEMSAVWEAASPVMKTSTPQERFIANTAQKRAQLGAIRQREWMAIMRVPISSNEGSLPEGQYISVRFATSGSNGRVMEEVISFRLDSDNQWRMVGYSLN